MKIEELPKDIRYKAKEFLEPDEEVIDFRKEPWSYYKRNRWLILTNKRLYMIKKIFFGISYDITQVILKEATFEMIEGILLDTIYVKDPAGKHILNFTVSSRDRTISFFKDIEKAREGEPEQNLVAEAELEALAKTFYENVISREEYEKKKKKILDKL